MKYNFDIFPSRLPTESIKWHQYEEDVLPMWVADMDFVSPQPVIDALQQRAAHGIFGYPQEPPGLRDVITARLKRLYNWEAPAEHLVLMPGVVTGFNLALKAFTQPGDGLLIQTPVYPPIFEAHSNHGLQRQVNPLVRQADGSYAVDFESFEAAITPVTRAFLLCNPHNPVGRVFTRQELSRMAEICLRHNLLIISDEIHCDLIYPGHPHTPIACLSPEIARRSITLMAPSKTFNVAGLESSMAIIPDDGLRRRYQQVRHGLASFVNIMGLTAALAAYRDGQEWLDQLMEYLDGNRHYLYESVKREMPSLRMGLPEGTYLAWLDCSQAGIQGKPYEFFLKNARVAVNDGEPFGPGGENFVRLNFGCPRPMLAEALERMSRSLHHF